MNLNSCVAQTEAMMRNTVVNFCHVSICACMSRWSDLHWRS